MRIEQIPLYEHSENVSLTGYIQHHPINEAAIIICAGGGYLSHNEDEAEYVAIQFLAHGYQAFVLNYSIGAPYACMPAPVLELAQAVVNVRENAQQYQVLPQRIYVCGLSTGGHMASLLGSVWNSPLLNLKEGEHARPSAVLLGYPVFDLETFRVNLLEKDSKYMPFLQMLFTAILAEPKPDAETLKKWNSTCAVSADTVPTFIWNYAKDLWVDRSQADAYAVQLTHFKIPHTYVTFETGSHGTIKLDQTKIWLTQALEWLKSLQDDAYTDASS